MSKIDDKISYLRECAKMYEAGKPIITDGEYDTLYNNAKAEDPQNSYFNESGAEIDEEHIYGKKIKHKVVFGSLNKCANIDEFSKFVSSTYKDTKSLEFVVQFKIDGLSLGCVFNKTGKLDIITTRGNSRGEGVDVTNNGRVVDGVPETVKCNEEVEVRGECYKDREDFYANWVGEYENPRSFASGSLNQIDSNVTKERGLSFVAYEIVRKEFDTETEKIKFLTDNKFNTLAKSTLIIKNSSPEEVVKKVKKFMDDIDRSKLPYALDGVVVKINDLSIKEEMGYTGEGRYSRSNVAIKFPLEQAETTLEDIELDTGKTGKISFVAILEPIRLNETTVTRATLYNAMFVETNKLTIGCKVLIQKGGEIIPTLVRKVSDGKNSTPFILPTKCPSCGEKLERTESGIDLVCLNPTCPAQLSRVIEYHFKTFGIKGLGSSTIDTLIEKKYVTYISDMYDLKKHTKELSAIFGDKAFANIVKAIDGVSEVVLSEFIESLSIACIGSMSKLITNIYPTIKDIDGLKAEDIRAIKGFGSVKSESFVDGWKKMRPEITKLLTYIKIKAKEANVSNKLSGKSFCITGTLSRPRNEIQKIIESNGGKVSGSVSAKLDYLICGDEAGSKKDKAEKLGVKVISEKDFEKMMN